MSENKINQVKQQQSNKPSEEIWGPDPFAELISVDQVTAYDTDKAKKYIGYSKEETFQKINDTIVHDETDGQ